MRSIHALAIVVALAAPFATAAGPAGESAPGCGVGLPDRHDESRASLEPAPARASRLQGNGLGLGRLRGGGNGIRLSTVADNAFGVPVPRLEPSGEAGDRHGNEAIRR